MTTFTVLHDGNHDDEIFDLAERHGTTAVRMLEGSWALFGSDGSKHVLPRGRVLRVTRISRRSARFEVLPAQRVQVRWDAAERWWVGSLTGDGDPQVVALADSQPVALSLACEALRQQAEVPA